MDNQTTPEKTIKNEFTKTAYDELFESRTKAGALIGAGLAAVFVTVAFVTGDASITANSLAGVIIGGLLAFSIPAGIGAGIGHAFGAAVGYIEVGQLKRNEIKAKIAGLQEDPKPVT